MAPKEILYRKICKHGRVDDMHIKCWTRKHQNILKNARLIIKVVNKHSLLIKIEACTNSKLKIKGKTVFKCDLPLKISGTAPVCEHGISNASLIAAPSLGSNTPRVHLLRFLRLGSAPSKNRFKSSGRIPVWQTAIQHYMKAQKRKL